MQVLIPTREKQNANNRTDTNLRVLVDTPAQILQVNFNINICIGKLRKDTAIEDQVWKQPAPSLMNTFKDSYFCLCASVLFFVLVGNAINNLRKALSKGISYLF
jgi:hypothetical protein